MTDWSQIVSAERLEKTVAALNENGFNAQVVESGEAAKKAVLEIIPEGAEVMTMTSATLTTIGVTQEINESGKYNAVKPKLMKMDRMTQGREMQKLGSAPDWATGSVHAVTEDGKIFIASGTGSQLAAYVYGASHVVLVVGGQKVAANIEAAQQRLYEHVLPLETQRMQKAHGVDASVNKILILNKEKMPNRISVILVKEALGF